MLYRITVKKDRITNGIRLEKGMTAEVSFQFSNLLGNNQGKELVRNAFLVKYGIDLQKACALDTLNLDVQRIN